MGNFIIEQLRRPKKTKHKTNNSMISILFGSNDLSSSTVDGDQSKDWKPTPTPTPMLQPPTPLHQALKQKKLHDEALQQYLKTNPTASKGELETFKQNFLTEMARSATPIPTTVPTDDNNTKSKSQEPPKVLPVKNLNSYFDPENSTNSNVRPSMLSGKSLIVPDNPLSNTHTPQSVRPVNISSSTPPPAIPLSSKTPDTDLASVASSGMSAPPSSATSPSIPTAATPNMSMWPFNSTTDHSTLQHPNIVPPTNNQSHAVQSLTPPTARMPSPVPVPAPGMEPSSISLWPFTSATNPPSNGEAIRSGSTVPSEVGSNATSMPSLWPFPSFAPEGMMTSMNPLHTPPVSNPVVNYKELMDQLIKEKVCHYLVVLDFNHLHVSLLHQTLIYFDVLHLGLC